MQGMLVILDNFVAAYYYTECCLYGYYETFPMQLSLGTLSGNFLDIVEGSLEAKLPTIWTDEKQSRAEAERRER